MPFRLTYSQTSRNQVRALHPDIKPIVKARIQELRDNPYLGKPLEQELCGYFSYRAKRFRIIYKIDDSDQVLEIHHVGHRRDIYEIFRNVLTKENQ